MRERGLEYKVGLLIVVSTSILVGFLFILGNYSLRSGFTIDVDFDYVGSLQAGAPVKLSGIKIGKVRAVELFGGKQDPALGKRVRVRVTAWVEARCADAIRSDAEFFINAAGVLGEQYLEIVPGKDWSHPPIQPCAVVHDEHFVHDPPRTHLVVARPSDRPACAAASASRSCRARTGPLRRSGPVPWCTTSTSCTTRRAPISWSPGSTRCSMACRASCATIATRSSTCSPTPRARSPRSTSCWSTTAARSAS